MYVNDKGSIIICHVDDPLIRCNKAADGGPSELQMVYTQLKEMFAVKELSILSRENPLDYLSIRIGVSPEGNIELDNDEKVTKVLTDHGMLDCNAAKTPLSKHHLTDIANQLEQLGEADGDAAACFQRSDEQMRELKEAHARAEAARSAGRPGGGRAEPSWAGPAPSSCKTPGSSGRRP